MTCEGPIYIREGNPQIYVYATEIALKIQKLFSSFHMIRYIQNYLIFNLQISIL
jgi:hypothetical protein